MADDRTQFFVDILTKMTGGDTSVAAITTLGDKMLAGKATVADFERTIKSMSGSLEQSAASMKSATDAVSLGQAKYSEAEASAEKAAKAVERMGALAEAQRGKLQAALDAGDATGAERAAAKLRNLTDRQAEMTAKSSGAAAALSAEAAALDAVRGKAGVVASQHDALKKGLANVKSAAEQAKKAEDEAGGTGSLRSLASGLGKIGGPAGDAGRSVVGLASAVKKVTSSLGAIGPYVAIGVAIVAIATAAIFATSAIGKWAVGLADANRTQSLLAQGIARSVAGGELLDGTITDLGAIVPQTREELMSMAGELAKTGLRGKDLSNALETAAVKAAKLKFGPDFSAQMLSLDVQSRRLHDNIGQIFGGLKIEGLLGGMSTLVALFDSSTASGKTLKFLFESLFQPIIDGVAGAIPSVERLFLHAEIFALKAYIALKPYSGAIKLLAEGFLIAAAIVVGVLGAAVVAVGAIMAATFLGPVIIIGVLIAAVINAADAIKHFFGDALDFVSGLGSQMIAGLVNGISGGATAVVNAMKGVVTGAVDAAKHALGIASPSKVFEAIGGHTAAGFAQGVDGGAGDAQGSLESMVAPPAGRGGAGRGGSMGDITVNITVDGAGKGNQELADDIEDRIRSFFEGLQLSIGGGEVPA